MTEEITEVQDIIREILESFTDHHDDIVIEAREYPGACYMTVKVAADDHPKVVGRRGANIRPLQALVARIGKANNELYTLKLLEPDPAPRRPSSPQKNPKQYDPAKAIELLIWTIAAALDLDDESVGVDCIQKDASLSYTLRITVRDPATLTEGETPLLSILSTLWHAWAQADGVSFVLEVAP